MKKTTKKPTGKTPVDPTEAVVLELDIGQLVPRYADAAANPNRMAPEVFASLVELIKTEGFLQPILVTRMKNGKYRIEDGHHRWWAARELGLTKVTAVVKESMTEDQRARLLGLGMNRLRGELDLSTAVDIIREVQAVVDNLELAEISQLSGFTSEELDLLLADSTDPGELLDSDVGTIGDIEREERSSDEKTYNLEIVFTDKDQYKLARRKLRRMGKGDLAHGVMVALGEDEE